MNPEDIRKLLGGYATGTLTIAEQEALFAAALEDQELFDALMKEEALRDVLQDPVSKSALLAALEQPAVRPAWWSWRPLIGAVAMAGIALGAIAVWRATREQPAPVIVAETVKQPSATIEPAPAPVPVAKALPPKIVAKDKVQSAAETRLKKEADSEASVKEAPVKREEPAAAAGPAAPQRPRVQLVQTPPPPMAQQVTQQQAAPSVSVETAQAMNRNTAISGFRASDSAGAVKSIGLDQLMDKKSGPTLQWSILRADREIPPDTILDAGETVRLRILSLVPGTVTLTEGDKVLATAAVEASKPFDTPPILFTSPGPRQFRLTLTSGAARPNILPITLTYGKQQ
jgi:hypothetical protein